MLWLYVHDLRRPIYSYPPTPYTPGHPHEVDALSGTYVGIYTGLISVSRMIVSDDILVVSGVSTAPEHIGIQRYPITVSGYLARPLIIYYRNVPMEPMKCSFLLITLNISPMTF